MIGRLRLILGLIRKWIFLFILNFRIKQRNKVAEFPRNVEGQETVVVE